MLQQNPAPLVFSADQHKPDARKIFVGGLLPTVTEEDLVTYFTAFGEIMTCDVKKDFVTGAGRGFAFIVFHDRDAAAAVLENYDNNNISGKWVEVKSCAPNGNVDAKPTDEKNIFAGGLPWDVTEEQVAEHFGKYGPVDKVDMKLNPQTGKPKGYCFVSFKDSSTAKQVLSVEHVMLGKRIDVKTAVIGIGKHSLRDKGGKGGGKGMVIQSQQPMLQHPNMVMYQPSNGYVQQSVQQVMPPQGYQQGGVPMYQPGVQVIQQHNGVQYVQMQQPMQQMQYQQVQESNGTQIVAVQPNGVYQPQQTEQYQPVQFQQVDEVPINAQQVVSYQVPIFDEPQDSQIIQPASYQPMMQPQKSAQRFNPY